MALDKLSDKLDSISESDLGMGFDDIAIWAKLESKLDRRKWILSSHWVAAACLALFILSPIVLKQTTSFKGVKVDSQISEKVVENNLEVLQEEVVFNEIPEIPVYSVEKKSLKGVVIADVMIKPVLKPIPLKEEKKRPQFAAKDISVIQANLGIPSIKKEKSVTIRAQLYTSQESVQPNNQSLKIKLRNTSNQE